MEQVQDWMTRELRSVEPTTSAHDALRSMEEGSVRHVLVRAADGELLGLISNRDVVRVVLQNAGRVFDVKGCTARDIMTPCPLHTVEPTSSLAEAAGLLREHQISALPVLGQGRVLGILTTADLLRTFEG